MTLAKSRSPLLVLTFLLLPFLFQGCLSTTRYRANPRIQIGTYVDIWSFSDAEINPKEVDKLYLRSLASWISLRTNLYPAHRCC